MRSPQPGVPVSHLHIGVGSRETTAQQGVGPLELPSFPPLYRDGKPGNRILGAQNPLQGGDLAQIAAVLATGYLRLFVSAACRGENSPCPPSVTTRNADQNPLDVVPQPMDEWSVRPDRRT